MFVLRNVVWVPTFVGMTESMTRLGAHLLSLVMAAKAAIHDQTGSDRDDVECVKGQRAAESMRVSVLSL